MGKVQKNLLRECFSGETSIGPGADAGLPKA